MSDKTASSGIARQLALMGEPPKLTGSYRAKVAYILREFPAARDDDKLCQYLYWLTYDGLVEVTVGNIGFEEWWLKPTTTSPETIRRRRQELSAEYPPTTKGVQEYREKMSKAGPPDRWR